MANHLDFKLLCPNCADRYNIWGLGTPEPLFATPLFVINVSSSFFSFVPESLRWLIVCKQFDKVEKIVHRIVSFNNLPYPEQVMQGIKNNSSQYQTTPGQKATVLDLFKSPLLRRRTFTLIIIW
jgi:hypothetical protein